MVYSHGDWGAERIYKDSPNSFVWPVRIVGDGVIELPKTGQRTSFYDGDDGDIQAGVLWPAVRFTDNCDGTVSDNLTGLIWTRNANLGIGNRQWQEGLDYIAGMNSGQHRKFWIYRLEIA